jgi:fumarate reductase flavoprotein subunit
MKKHFIKAGWGLGLLLALFAAGCPNPSGPETSGGIYQAGSYQQSAAGYNNSKDLTLTTVFSSTAIVSVTIDDHGETLSRQTVVTALAQIPAAIVERQRLDVDGVSTATKTSDGIKNAVKACVLAAGGDPAQLGAP